MRIINDCHIGTIRQAGTTPVSQGLLTEYIHQSFLNLLPTGEENTLVINGDLFDGFTADPKEVLWIYEVLADWLSGFDQPYLALVAGNHDWAPRADKLSSFHLLASLLTHRFPGTVEVIDHKRGLSKLWDATWAIPHMPNQDLFDMELAKAQTMDHGGILLLHANYDNNFAVESDHSLNVSPEQASALIAAGWKLVFAHEHQARNPREGVVIVGNQIPTSVADCLGNETKKFLEVRGNTIEHVECWQREPVYFDIDWRHTDMQFEGAHFIRVSGTASTNEAEAAINAVNQLRKRSTAFVVSNAVRVDGLAEMEQLSGLSFEEVTAFDVLGALCEELTPEEAKVVKELLA